VSVLERIVADTRATLARRRAELPASELERQALAQPTRAGRLRAALQRPGVAVIAEHKRRSPSAGAIRPGSTVAEIVVAYERGGAAAASILTEEQHFEGSLADLRAARAACALPLLRKDFVVERYQLLEARAAGADAVLLIVAALPEAPLTALHREADALGLDVLVEVHDQRELELALRIGAQLVGVNNRDLRDFSVDVERTFRLRERIPASVTVVSESGIHERAQLERLGEAGVDAVLVGESLMRAEDPQVALARLVAAS
jgi:indole-3-glycerol phosphate synthase